MKRVFDRRFLKQKFCMGLAAVMALSVLLPLPAAAESAKRGELPAAQETSVLKAGSKAADDAAKTIGQPFASGTAGSSRFRIPAMITLNNGDILTAADARWDTSRDMGGLDTIASISSDGGNTWNYSFPFYFPDTDGYAGANAATFIDPALVQGPDGTIYCFADVLPTGYWLQDIQSHEGTGFITVEGRQYLALTDDYTKSNTKPTDDDNTTYAYYVGDFASSDGSGVLYAPIISRSNNQPTDYAVDEWYNIYEKNGSVYEELTQPQILNENNDKNDAVQVQQNAFYRDSMFHVYRIGYTWVITSKDGRTWEHPKNITNQIMRETGEDVLLISPGRGLTTKKNGDILLGDYYYKKGGSQLASMIYSTDNGKSWNRTEEDVSLNAGTTPSAYTTENEIVELKNGNLLMFYRNTAGYLCYAHILKESDGSYTIGSNVRTSARLNSGKASYCNISAISYSREVDGRQIILVSTPTGEVHPNARPDESDDRISGRIYAFSVESSGALSLAADPFPILNSYDKFQYSCLTELDDGSIGLLWEDSDSSVRFDRYDILDIMPYANISGVTVHVDLEIGGSYEREYAGTGKPSETMKANTEIADEDAGNGYTVEADLYDRLSNDANVFTEAFSSDANEELSLSDLEFTFTKSRSNNTGEYYQMGNRAHNLYVASYKENGTHLFKDAPADMCVERVEDTGLFRFSAYDTEKRYMIFYSADWRFDGYGNLYPDHIESGDVNNGDFTLFERSNKNSEEEDSVINGYTPVKEIKSGKKYLIAYVYTDASDNNAKRAIVLCPESSAANSYRQSTKLVGKNAAVESDSNKKYVSFTAKAAGETTAIIDGVTYKIRVTDPNASGGGAKREDKTIEMKPGDTYLEKVTASEIVSLYGSAASAALADGFDITAPVQAKGSSAVLDTKLTDMEFTFAKSDRGENKWTVYNEKKGLYLRNNGTNVYSSTPGEMIVKPLTYEGLNGKYADYKNTYSIYYDNKFRHLVFWTGQNNGSMSFNAYAETEDPNSYTGDPALYYRPLMLFEKMIPFSEDEKELCLGGYVPVTKLKDGGKYLIGFIDDDKTAYLLDAGANYTLGNGITKYIAGGAETTKTDNEEKFLSIKANNTGFTSVVAGGIGYRIYVRNEGVSIKENILLESGKSHTVSFQTGVDCTVPDSNAVQFVFNGTKTRKLKNSSNGVDIGNCLEKGEFTFHSMSAQDPAKADYYQVVAKQPQNAAQKYFGAFSKSTNNNVFYFTDDAGQYVCAEKISDSEGGQIYFKISKAQQDMTSSPAVCFHTTGTGTVPDVPMYFNMTSHEAAALDDTNLTLFEKDIEAEGTPLPGYKRATEIKDGAVYLIAYEWTGNEDHAAGIYIINPQNGIWNSTRLVGTEDIYSGVTEVVAVPVKEMPDAVSFLAGNEMYTFEIANTVHEGHDHAVLGAFPADCYENGFTGDIFCPEEKRIVAYGEEILAAGHRWDSGTITTPLTIDESGYATADGEITYTCSSNQTPAHTKKEKIYAYAYNHLKDQCVLAEEEMDKAGYNQEALEELRTVYQIQNAVLTTKESGSMAYYAAGEVLQSAIYEAKRASGIIEAEDITLSETDIIALYPGDTRQLTVTILPENATDKTVIWKSSNQNTATVVNGLVTAVARGRTTITAKIGKRSKSVSVIVKKRPVDVNPECTCTIDAIAVSPKNLTITIGADEEKGTIALAPEAQIGGNCKESGHPQRANYSYKIKDAGTTRASVSNQGVVTASEAGKAVITITAVSATSNSTREEDVTVIVYKKSDDKGNIKDEARKELIVGKEYQADGATYIVLDKDTVTIKKGWNRNIVKIPDMQTIEGVTCRVVGIEAEAFKNYNKIKSVILGANIETVSGKAFVKCQNLNTVTISANVKKLSKNAFFQCKKIKKVVFQGAKLPSMKNAFKKTSNSLTVKVKKSLRNSTIKKKKLMNKLKKAGLKVKLNKIK